MIIISRLIRLTFKFIDQTIDSMTHKENLRKKLIIPKIFFSVLFSALFIVLTKVKLTPIFGTETKFSASVMFGPVLSGLLGIKLGTLTIIASHVVGVIIGLYKIKSIMNLFVFTPILVGGIYFARMFRGDIRLVLIPTICIVLFLLHPIGREVWFYSLFWFIPIVITKFKSIIDRILKHHIAQVYSYSFGTAFVDHSVGSIIYLYFMNIPAQFWIAAIPFTFVERAVIAAGITFSYLFVKTSIKIMQDVAVAVALTAIQREKEWEREKKIKEGVKIESGK